MIYLDAAATSPVRREAIEAMFPYLTGVFGNPSSHHGLGEQAAKALADAREQIAEVVGARPAAVTFTSGGTEADNLAVKGIALARRAADPRRNRLLLSAIEHPAVQESAEFLHRVHGFDITVLPVDAEGFLNASQLAQALAPDAALLSVMYANNEIGTVQDLPALSALAAEHGVPLHTDAVQAAGWLPLDMVELGTRAMSLSGHKFGAPKGIGVLVLDSRTAAEPLIHGGGQQSGLRSGTENVAFAVAMATAVSLAEAERVEAAARVSVLRDEFIRSILSRVPGAVSTGPTALMDPAVLMGPTVLMGSTLTGPDGPTYSAGLADSAGASPRLPSIASFCFPGTHGESVLLELERRSVICSSGSACAAGSAEPSSVLLAVGLSPEVAQTAVRFSFSPLVTGEELRLAADEVVEAVRALGRFGRS